MKTINIYKKIIRIVLIILGLILLSLFIWSRFIRQRLPREIPFNLTELGFILLVISRYILYSLKYAKEQYILHLEYTTDGILTDFLKPEDDSMFKNCLKPRRFIEEQTFAIVYEDKAYTYDPMPSNKYRKNNNLLSTHTLTDKELDTLFSEFYNIMNILIPLAVHIEEYDFKNEIPRIIRAKIIIFSMYLICWSYLLYKSFHTLPGNSFEWLYKIQDL